MKRPFYELFRFAAIFVPTVFFGFGARAQSGATSSQSGLSCAGLNAYPSIVVIGQPPTSMFYYCKNADSTVVGSKDLRSNPGDIPIPFKNTNSVTVIVKGINPVKYSYTVSFDGTPFSEIDGSAIGKFLGLASPSASTATPGPAADLSKTAQKAQTQLKTADEKVAAAETTQAETSLACATANSDPHSIFSSIQDLQGAASLVAQRVATYNSDVSTAQQAYLATLNSLQQQNPSLISTAASTQQIFQGAVSQLMNGQKKASSLADLPKLDTDKIPNFNAQSSESQADVESSSLKLLVGKPLDEVVNDLSAQAVRLHGQLQSSVSSECRPALQSDIDQDQVFLESLFNSTGSTTSLADEWTSELNAAKTVANNLVTEETTLQNIANNPGSFEIDARIPPEDRIQTAVKVTVTWTANNTSATQQGANNQPGSGGSSKPSKGGSKSSATNPPSNAPSTGNASGSMNFTINFGQGPRIFESAGVVFSHLEQHTFATATMGSSAECPAKIGGNAAQGCIVDDEDSGWRILPVAMASVRVWDVNFMHFDWRQAVPNYLSFGATIKTGSNSTGSNNSTTLEYIAGPTWAIAGQSLFLTGGAYAGQVTELGGGLKVGAQAMAPPTTLPTTSSYKWGFGFAITYKFSQQGSTAGKVSNPSKSSTPANQ